MRRRQCETSLSTQCPQKVPPTRFPPPHVLTFRPHDHPEPSSAGPVPVVSLIERVTDRGSFVALRRPARRVRRGVLRIAYLPDDSGRTRIAYALSRRVGNAVQRNRIRRRLRSVFTLLDQERAVNDEMIFPAGTYLVSATADAATVPFETLMTTTRSLLEELNKHGARR